MTTDPLLGRLVDGRYEVISRIARGGMATVYLAVDRRLDREVALKVMHPHLADGVDGAEFVARFRREARAAARLAHPGVVAVYDQGLDGETSYLTMEYVPGTTLRRVLREEGTLPLGRALDVVEEVLGALAAAHRKGLVHRDVKPENVLLTEEDDRVKVADFGLARAVTEVTSTTTGTVLGTVAYLAPEVIATGACDARTDVYAVGVLAYELVTGSQPHTGTTPIQVAFLHVNEDVPRPSGVVPWLPTEVDELLAALTARDPAQRPVDAGAALEAVRAVRRSLDDATAARRAEPPAAPAAPDPAEDDDAPDDEPALDAIPTAAFRPDGDRPGDLDDGGPATGAHGTIALRADEVPGPGTGEHPTVALERPRRRRALWWSLVVVLLLGGGAAGTWWWFEHGPGAWTTVPSGVVGAVEAEATTTLDAAGLGVTRSEAFDDDVAAGAVVSTDPGEGERVRTDGSVHLVVSRGVEMLTVPTGLVGASQEDATAAIEAAGFAPADPETAHDDEVPAGTVLAVSVEEGSEQRHDTPVVLTVSDGPAPVQVTQQVGRSKDDAVAELEALGLRADFAPDEHSETVPAGDVIRQSPESGAQAHRTDTVTLTVSLGPPIVEVPDVVGQRTGAARDALEKAGLVVKENKYLGGLLDTVRFQDVTGTAPKGTTVTLTIW